MARPRVRWATWFAGLAAVAAVAGGLWYAHGRGWLASVEERVHRSAERSRVDRPEGDSMGGMPGMEMGGMEEVARRRASRDTRRSKSPPMSSSASGLRSAGSSGLHSG